MHNPEAGEGGEAPELFGTGNRMEEAWSSLPKSEPCPCWVAADLRHSHSMTHCDHDSLARCLARLVSVIKKASANLETYPTDCKVFQGWTGENYVKDPQCDSTIYK